jgi:lipase chaperone LimK
MPPSSKKNAPTSKQTGSQAKAGKAKDVLTYFVTVAQQLSIARDLSTVQKIVRKAVTL